MSQEELSFRAPSQRSAGPTVWSVSQVVRGANRLMEARFSNLWIEGEVTGLKVAASGHAFFTLRDEGASLPSAMWRTSLERQRFELAEGQKLRCFGRLGIFAKQGRFQFYVDRAEPAGLGEKMLELEQRKKRLAALGLFDADRKRALPRWPRAIGIVTSSKGAALHDILEVARHRCPSRLVLAPAVVQGPEAPHAVVRALQRVAALPGIDVVIVGRGGGSAEDLWAFNDERIARAVADCPVPVVSAVGHEVDVSICDLVADVRAATPSHAAQLVVPDRAAALSRLATLQQATRRTMTRAVLDERSRLDDARRSLHGAGRSLTGDMRGRLDRLRHSLSRLHPRESLHRDRRRLDALRARLHAAARTLPLSAAQRLDALDDRLAQAGRSLHAVTRARLDRLRPRLMAAGPESARRARVRLARLAGALDALSPLRVLERGYAVVTDESGRALLDATDTKPGAPLNLRLHRGRVRAEVRGVEPEASPDPVPSPKDSSS